MTQTDIDRALRRGNVSLARRLEQERIARADEDRRRPLARPLPAPVPTFDLYGDLRPQEALR